MKIACVLSFCQAASPAGDVSRGYVVDCYSSLLRKLQLRRAYYEIKRPVVLAIGLVQENKDEAKKRRLTKSDKSVRGAKHARLNSNETK